MNSLRDVFACSAMQGILSNPALTALTDEEIAKSAYAVADQMMKHLDTKCPVCGAVPGEDGIMLHQSGCTWGWE